MYSTEEKAEIIAKGAHTIAQRNVAVAMSRFGYKPPTAAQPVASATTAPPAPKVVEPVPVSSPESTEADRRVAQDFIAAARAAAAARKEEKAAEAKDGWKRAMATATGKPLPSKKSAADGWARVMSNINGQTG